MEWKLERAAARRVRTDEAALWERVLRALGRDLGQSRTRRWPQQPAEGTRWEAAAHQSCSWDHPCVLKRIPSISTGTTPDSGKTTYSRFKSSIVKKLTSSVPVASSPISTRWQQAHMRSEGEQTFTECRPINLSPSDGSELTRTPEEITKIPVTSPMLIKTSAMEPVINMHARYHKAYREVSQGRNKRPAESTNEQKCQILMVQEYGVSFPENGRMKICENMECIWEGCQDGIQNEFTLHRVSLDTEPFLPLEPEVRFHITGFRNDYYLNTLDWNHENLIAVALGSCAYIWNGETHRSIESIDLNSSAKYISSIAWIKEGTCLAVGTSDGEVQLWDIESKKRLRNMVGHLSVVGAMSWNHYILSSGSRLGFVHHHDVRVAQHHVGTLCQNKQSICSLKWSLNNKLLASGSSDGILNIWPSDPGVTVHCKPVQTMPHPSAVKAMNWCPWQSEILATGGGLKDGLLRVWDISSGKTIKTTETKSQICSLVWLPNTNELVTGHGLPKNQIKIWKYPMLANSVELFGHKGRVLHVALSPDCSRFISLAADGMACVWKYFQSSETRHRRDDIQGDYSRTSW